jgi:dipicolinate synthase subunit A
VLTGGMQMKGKKFTIIGGDLRNIKLANQLTDDGNDVNVFGFDKAGFELGIKSCSSLTEAIDDSDIVIGPIPCSNDNETINAPFYSDRIYIHDVFKKMTKNQLFLAGRISEKISNMSQIHNVYFIDLLEREEMAVLNAIPTAEGAIQIAMEEMPITIHDSKSLVLGYGRLGKMVSKLLNKLGSEVFVEARKYSDFAWIRSNNYNPIHINEISKYLPDMDLVINTITTIMLSQQMLSAVRKDCLLIDLASKPGGIDFEKARDMGLKAIWALSLPGKVAPVTAAKYIKETVYNIMDELGV